MGEFEAYTNTVAGRLRARGFRRHDGAPTGYDAVTFRKRAVWLRTPGVIDVVCIVASFEDPPIPAVERFSDRSFAFATANGEQWPLGIGRTVVAIPVAACRAPGDRLMRDVEAYRPVRRGAIEFPVVVDLSAGSVHYNTVTPAWGRSTSKRLRQLVTTALVPPDADLADLEF